MRWSTEKHGLVFVFFKLEGFQQGLIRHELPALRFEQWTDILNPISHCTRSLICIWYLAVGKKVGYNNKVAAKGATIIYDDPRWCLYQMHTLYCFEDLLWCTRWIENIWQCLAAKCFFFPRLTILTAQWRVVRLLTLNGDVSTKVHSHRVSDYAFLG